MPGAGGAGPQQPCPPSATYRPEEVEAAGTTNPGPRSRVEGGGREQRGIMV